MRLRARDHGLSGGIDSALTAAIAVDAVGKENVIGVGMPGPYSSEHSVTDARDLAHNLGIRFELIPIRNQYEAFLKRARAAVRRRDAAGVTEENLQSRLRGVTLMALSNKWGALVLTTGNKSELAVGYCTLYGDMCGGLAVISDVPKTLVYSLSRVANKRHANAIPENIFVKPPSAELRPDQKDTDSLPDYDVLDQILRGYIENNDVPAADRRCASSACNLGARHCQQSGPQRIQAPAGRARPEGNHQGVRHRPPLSHRPEVLRMKPQSPITRHVSSSPRHACRCRVASYLLAARAARTGRPAGRRRIPAQQRLAREARGHADSARHAAHVLAFSRTDGRFLLVLNGGYNPPSLSVLDTKDGHEIGRTPVPDAWLGMALSPNGRTLWVGGGSQAAIFEFSFDENGKLQPTRTFEIVKAAERTAHGFHRRCRLAPDGHLLYACDLYHDSIVVVNPQSGIVIDHFKTGRRPYRILFHPDGKSFFVTSWADGTLHHQQTNNGSHVADAAARRASHRHGLARSRRALGPKKATNQPNWKARIFVSAANTNNVYSVGVVRQRRSARRSKPSTSPRRRNHPLGMTPSALALSADQNAACTWSVRTPTPPRWWMSPRRRSHGARLHSHRLVSDRRARRWPMAAWWC